MYIRHSDAVKSILKYLPILSSFTIFITATATGLVGGERSDFPELGSPYPAYMPNSNSIAATLVLTVLYSSRLTTCLLFLLFSYLGGIQ